MLIASLRLVHCGAKEQQTSLEDHKTKVLIMLALQDTKYFLLLGWRFPNFFVINIL